MCATFAELLNIYSCYFMCNLQRLLNTAIPKSVRICSQTRSLRKVRERPIIRIGFFGVRVWSMVKKKKKKNANRIRYLQTPLAYTLLYWRRQETTESAREVTSRAYLCAFNYTYGRAAEAHCIESGYEGSRTRRVYSKALLNAVCVDEN